MRLVVSAEFFKNHHAAPRRKDTNTVAAGNDHFVQCLIPADHIQQIPVSIQAQCCANVTGADVLVNYLPVGSEEATSATIGRLS